ncbi:uncharacterized protein LOC110913413 [Helianthus annuus]|uniref:uncharacterized protein LOC110913413 n=1 Tax=Helianthus annuus TaxID=4232 RepID=UPI000B8F7123|nr:uncharacterized protein LOC110913413 [Helianthus annuus]
MNGGRLWDWEWSRAPSDIEERQEMVSLNDLLRQQNLSNSGDVWIWKNNEHQEFSVKNVKYSLSQNFDLNSVPCTFIWNNWVTTKGIMFVWRAIEEKIPSALALRSRGMNQIQVICKTCGAAEETAGHILLSYNFARRIWEAITFWLKIPMVNAEGSIAELLQEISDIPRSRKMRKLIHAVVVQTMWVLWKIRNEKVFSGRQV